MLKQICFVFLCFVLGIQAEVLEYEEILREGAKLGDVSPVCSNQINAIPQEALVQSRLPHFYINLVVENFVYTNSNS